VLSIKNVHQARNERASLQARLQGIYGQVGTTNTE